LYALVNLITRDQFEQFTQNPEESQEEFSDDFIRALNLNQTILRLKFFGGNLYGNVKYFVPMYEQDTNTVPDTMTVDDV